MHPRSLPARSWEMRWYRQRPRELIRDELADLVPFADEEVVDALHHGDARIRDDRAQLVGCSELVVLRRHDERPRWDERQLARCEVHVLRSDPNERDRLGPAAAREIGEHRERAEAVAGERQREAALDGAGVGDGGCEIVRLIATSAPGPRALADAAEVEAQRVPAPCRARACYRGHDRRAHRACVRRQGMGDHDDRRRIDIRYPQRRLETPVDALWLLAHLSSVEGTAGRRMLYSVATMQPIGGLCPPAPGLRPRALALLALGLAGVVACQGAISPTSSSPSAGPAGSAGAPSAAAAGSLPTREASCAMRVSASFTIANDLSCQGDGLVIVEDNVTVDLGGHTLTGPGMGPQPWPLPQLDSVGVRVAGRSGVTIRNGKTVAFSTGIYFVDTTASTIDNVTTQHNRFGFYIHNSTHNTVKGSDVEFNIYGLHLQSSDGNLLQGNLLARQTYNSPGGYGLYMYSSKSNKVVENTIDSNINWGIWFSDAKENAIFHNNVIGNNPQVSDNTEGSNVWYDPTTKEGNYWADYKGKDSDNDLIGDTPYPILGPGGMVDAYPFVEKDGWTRKRRATIDHYEPAAPRPARGVTVVAPAGGSSWSARPTDARATLRMPDVSQIALGTDERTVYATSGKTVLAEDIVPGEVLDLSAYAVDGIVAANRDGHSVMVVGPLGVEERDLETGQAEFFSYSGQPKSLAPSYKHNHVVVATPPGIELHTLN